MNHLETNYKEVPVNGRPLFASPWIALFTVLRKNYKQRSFAVATPGTVNSETLANERPETKLN
jgi:hypothetical protein